MGPAGSGKRLDVLGVVEATGRLEGMKGRLGLTSLSRWALGLLWVKGLSRWGSRCPGRRLLPSSEGTCTQLTAQCC